MADPFNNSFLLQRPLCDADDGGRGDLIGQQHKLQQTQCQASQRYLCELKLGANSPYQQQPQQPPLPQQQPQWWPSQKGQFGGSSRHHQSYIPFDGQRQHPTPHHCNVLVPMPPSSNLFDGAMAINAQQWQSQSQSGQSAVTPRTDPAPQAAARLYGPICPPDGQLSHQPQPPQQCGPGQQSQQQQLRCPQLTSPSPPQPLPLSPAVRTHSLDSVHPVSEVAIVPDPIVSGPGSHASANQSPFERESQTPTGTRARNKYSATLAQGAPLGASPLPRADMVRKTGYVLSRISFRTIVMKKWKQTFWVQYGPHTMLWFRSQADFDDWLNNPYHSQAQRNFLIKLAVNFAHDLYKPNVRGYQVTQCRTKSYGPKLIRQFKLERWMDYGPTIAAAFGSNNPKEVDDLRGALVACMRNTPLNGGIRATGAVRASTEDGYGGSSERHGSASSSGHQARRLESRSVASASDMLNDQEGFDGTDSVGAIPGMGGLGEAPDLLDFAGPCQQPSAQNDAFQQCYSSGTVTSQQGQHLKSTKQSAQQHHGTFQPRQYGSPYLPTQLGQHPTLTQQLNGKSPNTHSHAQGQAHS